MVEATARTLCPLLGTIHELQGEIVCSCGGATVIRDYSGEQRPNTEVAVVAVDGRLNIHSSDGTGLWRGSFVEFIPGEHALEVNYSDANYRSIEMAEITINVEAGRFYQLTPDVRSKILRGTSWKPEFVEVNDPAVQQRWLRARKRKLKVPPCDPEEYWGSEGSRKEKPGCDPYEYIE